MAITAGIMFNDVGDTSSHVFAMQVFRLVGFGSSLFGIVDLPGDQCAVNSYADVPNSMTVLCSGRKSAVHMFPAW